MPAKPSIPLSLWLLNGTLAVVVGLVAFRVWFGGSGLPEKELQALRLVHQSVLEHHIDPHDGRKLLEEAIDGLVHSLDPWSDFVPAAQAPQFDEGNSGTYEGIGIQLLPRAVPPTIFYPISGSPAERAGLEVGDRILAVDGKDMASKQGLEQLAEHVRGPRGTQVRLRIERDGAAPFEVAVERAPVQQRSVQWARMLDPAAGVGYLHVSSFQHDTVKEFDAEIATLLPLGLRTLVIDLRQNGGGLLDESVLLANRFLTHGNIVTLKKRGGDVEARHDAKPQECRHEALPLVLLIDGSSASASEVFAGALQDHGRARIVGERSYGKGFVQSIYRWKGADFRLKLTTAHYFTPKGRDINQRVRPTAHVRDANGLLHRAWERVNDVAEADRGGITPEHPVALPRGTAPRIHAGLDAREIPAVRRERAKALAARHRVDTLEPAAPADDPQLQEALAQARLLLGLDSRPATRAAK